METDTNNRGGENIPETVIRNKEENNNDICENGLKDKLVRTPDEIENDCCSGTENVLQNENALTESEFSDSMALDLNKSAKHHCLNSISMPRNWSQIERLKMQRNKLREKLLDVRIQSKKKELLLANSPSFEKVQNIPESQKKREIVTELKNIQQVDTDDSHSDSDGDSIDQLFIDDKEINDVNPQLINSQVLGVTPTPSMKSSDETSSSTEPKLTGTRSSKSLNDCTTFLHNEDFDLCELRVSTINNSLFKAIANAEMKASEDISSTLDKSYRKVRIQTKSIDAMEHSNSYKVPKVAREQLIKSSKSVQGLNSNDDPLPDRKEKQLNRSVSDTCLSSEEACKRRAEMKQKLKRFLKSTTKNDLLEKLFMRKIKNSNHLIKPVKTVSRNNVSDSGRMDLPQSEKIQTLSSKQSEVIEEEKLGQSDEIGTKNKSSLSSSSEVPNIYQEKLLKELEILKIEKNVNLMKTKILQNETMRNYLNVLEMKCQKQKNQAEQSQENYLRKSASSNNSFANDNVSENTLDSPQSTDEGHSNIPHIKSKVSNGSVSPGAGKNYDRISEGELNTSKNLTSLTSPTTLTKKNMRSLLANSVQPTVEMSQSVEHIKDDCKGTKTEDVIKHQPILLNHQRLIPPCTSVEMPVKTPTTAASGQSALTATVVSNSTLSEATQLQQADICLLDRGTSPPMYALINKAHHSLYKVSNGVLHHPSVTLQVSSSGNTGSSIAYLGQSIIRPLVTTGQVKAQTAGHSVISPVENMVTSRVSSPAARSIMTTRIHSPLLMPTHERSLFSSDMVPDTKERKSKHSKKDDDVDTSCEELKKSGYLPLHADFDTDSNDISTADILDQDKESLNTGNFNNHRIEIVGDAPQPNSTRYPLSANEEDHDLTSNGFHQKSCSKTCSPREVASWMKVDDDLHISYEKLNDEITSVSRNKGCSLTKSRCEKRFINVVNSDSESNDSFDSIDMHRYKKQKENENKSFVDLTSENKTKCETTNITDKDMALASASFERRNPFVSVNSPLSTDKRLVSAPSVCSLQQEGPTSKKYMKAKFIILQGDICDKWLEVKRKAGFSTSQDINFVHYLLKMVEARQIEEKVSECSEHVVMVADDNKNNNSVSGEEDSLNQEDDEEAVPKVQRVMMKQDESKNVSIIRSRSSRRIKQKRALKRVAENRTETDGTQSNPKKAKCNSSSGENSGLGEGKYNYLSKSVQKQMFWAVTVFREWLKGQGEQDFRFEYQGIKWLNGMLERFYLGAHSLDNDTYSANNLQNLRRFLSLYLEGHAGSSCVNISIPLDPGFTSSNQVLANIMKNKLITSYLSPDQQPISQEDLEKIYSSEALSDKNPKCLLWKVWFDISYHLCSGQFSENFLKSQKKHNLTLQSDVNGVFYTFTDDVCLPPDEAVGKMYATPHVPEHCPVRTTTVYLSNLCRNCDALFQCPNTNWKPGKRWYFPVPLSLENLRNTMAKISAKAQLSRIYKTSNVFATALHLKNVQ